MSEDSTVLHETRFGEWFQNTQIWRDYVLAEAVSELVAMLPAASRHFDSLLDVGCGRGQAFDLLTGQLDIGRIVGVDLDPHAIEAARARRVSAPLELLVGDVCDLELPPASVDLVFCHQTLHHINDHEHVLAQLWRVLRPGGTLLLAEACRRFIRSFAVRALFRHPMEVQRSPREYTELIGKAGFVVADDGTHLPEPFWSRPDFGLREWLGGRAPSYTESGQVRVFATKPLA